MNIGIVLVTYSMVPENLFKSIEGKTIHTCRWYVHHHGNDQSLIEPLRDIAARYDVHLYLHMFNRGLARSWNDGIGESLADTNDITLVINDDIEFINDGFNFFIQFIDSSKPDVGLVFLRGIEGENSSFAGEVRNQDFGCFAIGQQAIKQIGFFDENLVPAYYEDLDYSFRARKSGVKRVLDERILVRHDRSNTIRQNSAYRIKIQECVSLNMNYIIRKWGVDTWDADKAYDHPFNHDAHDLKIPWENRHAPYGPDHDRDDLNILRLLMWSGNDTDVQKRRPPYVQAKTESKTIKCVTKTHYSGRAVFDHLQKTAGMAIDDWLVRHLGPGSVTPLLTGHLRALIDTYGGNYPIISGHILFDGTGLDPRYQIFSVLRDPVDRLISWLYYVDKNMALDEDSRELKLGAKLFLSSEGEETNNTFLVSIDTFYLNRFSSVVLGGNVMPDVRHNYFSHFIVPNATGQQKLSAALAVIAEYDLVGFYDNLPQFTARLADLLQLTAYKPLRAVNVTTNRPDQNAISEKMHKNILKMVEGDQEFYAKSKELAADRARKKCSFFGIRPFNRDFTVWNYGIGPLRPYWRGAYMDHFLAKDLPTNNGMVTGQALVSNGTGGYLCYGPYLKLSSGHYCSVANGTYITRGAGYRADVCSGRGRIVHAKQTLVDSGQGDSNDWVLTMDFTLGQESYDIEFRMEAPVDCQILLSTVTILNLDKIQAMLCVGKDVSAAKENDAPSDLGETIISAMQMSSRIASRLGPTLQTTGRNGFLCYGPYMTLGKGAYRIELVGCIGPRGLAGAYAEAVCDSGKKTLHRQLLTITPFNEFSDRAIGQPWELSLDQNVNDLEIRLWVSSQSEINLCGIVLQRIEDDEEHKQNGETHDI